MGQLRSWALRRIIVLVRLFDIDGKHVPDERPPAGQTRQPADKPERLEEYLDKVRSLPFRT